MLSVVDLGTQWSMSCPGVRSAGVFEDLRVGSRVKRATSGKHRIKGGACECPALSRAVGPHSFALVLTEVPLLCPYCGLARG